MESSREVEDAILRDLVVQFVGVAAPMPEKPDLVIVVADGVCSQYSSATEAETRVLPYVDAPPRKKDVAEEREELSCEGSARSTIRKQRYRGRMGIALKKGLQCSDRARQCSRGGSNQMIALLRNSDVGGGCFVREKLHAAAGEVSE